MRRLLIVLVISIILFGTIALGAEAPTITLGIGAKIWNAGHFILLNLIANTIAIEVGVGRARVVGTTPPFDEMVPAGFLDAKNYYPLKFPQGSKISINPYTGVGVLGVHYDEYFPGIGMGTITAGAVETVAGLDISLPTSKLSITVTLAIYAHVIKGAVLSFAGETYPFAFGTNVPAGFQLGIRLDF